MLWYLASPYSKYPRGINAAFEDVCAAAAELLKRGTVVYSPIAHMHPIAMYGNIDPLDHSIWLDFDSHMMAACDGMIILEMPGWDTSYGVEKERQAFLAAVKPIKHITWPELIER